MAFKIQKPKLGNQLFTFRVLFYIFHCTVHLFLPTRNMAIKCVRLPNVAERTLCIPDVLYMFPEFGILILI